MLNPETLRIAPIAERLLFENSVHNQIMQNTFTGRKLCPIKLNTSRNFNTFETMPSTFEH